MCTIKKSVQLLKESNTDKFVRRYECATSKCRQYRVKLLRKKTGYMKVVKNRIYKVDKKIIDEPEEKK